MNFPWCLTICKMMSCYEMRQLCGSSGMQACLDFHESIWCSRVRAEVMLHTREFAAAMRDLDKALEIDPTEMAILRYTGLVEPTNYNFELLDGNTLNEMRFPSSLFQLCITLCTVYGLLWPMLFALQDFRVSHFWGYLVRRICSWNIHFLTCWCVVIEQSSWGAFLWIGGLSQSVGRLTSSWPLYSQPWTHLAVCMFTH